MSRSTSWTLAAGAAILLCSTPPGCADNNADGRSIFRFDTFGDEQLWTETLQMEQVIRNVSPRIALARGVEGRLGRAPTVSG